MLTEIRDELITILEEVGLNSEASLLAMHLTEIEEEADRALDLLIALRAHARNHETEAAEEGLAELAISLSHLQHHVEGALPTMERQLGIADEGE